MWRYLGVKGLEYTEEFQTYEMQKYNAMARDGGSASIDFKAGTGRRSRPLRNVIID